LSYIFAADSTGLSSKRRVFATTECISAVQGHPRSTILVPIESAYATSYYAVIVTLVILHRFWDTATYWLRILRIFPTPLAFCAPAPRGEETVRVMGLLVVKVA